jgi:hypothetical protein
MFSYRGGLSYIEPLVLKRQQNLREDQHQKKLYIIKGKKHPRVVRVEIDVANMNHGDIFVVDDDVKIWVWSGSKSNRLERGKALDTTTRLRDERMNRVKAEIIQIQDGRETEEFWKVLGTSSAANPQEKIKSEAEGGDDEAFENKNLTDDTLYKVAEETEGIPTVTPAERSQPLHRDQLESNASYIVDSGTEIFVWWGRDASQTVRTEASTYAEALKADGSRPSWVEITSMAQAVETTLFKMKFRGVFKEYMETPEHYKDRLTKFHKIAHVRQEKINVDALHHPEKYAIAKEDDYALMEKLIPHKEENSPDSFTKIWYMVGKKMVELPQEEYGIFYSHNCYVMHYHMRLPGRETRSTPHFFSRCYAERFLTDCRVFLVDVIYFWLGRSSSIDDKGSAAMQAADYSKQFGRSVLQVRVVQNREPDHFLSHFVHKFVVRRGKREQWMETVQKRASLYQVRGKDNLKVRAIEMEAVSFVLSTSDVFIATNPIEKRAFIWRGKNSSDDEFAYAQEFVKSSVALVASSASDYRVEICKEGEEPKLFWDTLGGKSEYSTNFDLARKCRFFFCTDRTSVFKVNLIEDFIQDDLLERGVVMLDGFVEIFLWVGAKASQKEKDMAMQTAEDYIHEADDGRPSNCPLYRVNANEEPNSFYVYFHGWDHAPQKDSLPGSPPVAIKVVEPTPTPAVAVAPKSAALTPGIAAAGRPRMSSAAPPIQRLQPVTVSSDSLPLISPRRSESKALLLKAAVVAPGETASVNTPRNTEKNPLNPEGVTWDFDRLRVKPLPPGVEPTKLESYLSAAEFEEILKMTPEAFYKQPKWKQTVLKKEALLF